MKQCNFQNNSGTVAYSKVSSCAPIFKFLYGPVDFPLGENLFPKLPFSRFLGCKPTFLKPQR